MSRDPHSDPVLSGFAAEIGPSGPVTIKGGGTHWLVGGGPDPMARVVAAPTGIVNFQPSETTVEVRAGTTVTELHAALAEHGQRTSLPEDPGSTVGGALALGWSGTARLGRGLTRDAVLQIRYVGSAGELVTAGGPTVKNVSGFDVCRLMIGSLGTLGCIADTILRTRPIPQLEVWHSVVGIDPADVLRSCATAASILWDGSCTWIMNAGYGADVEHDLAVLAEISAKAGVDRPASADPPKLPPHRWSRRPSEALAMGPDDAPFVAEIGVGMVHVDHPVSPSRLDEGSVLLLRRVKQAFDPESRFNPGRRVGGM